MMATPCYIVDYNKFEENCSVVMEEFNSRWSGNVLFGYSVKTNRYSGLIRYAYKNLGWKVETVSMDEYQYCIDIGIPPQDIVLNGPCKIFGLKNAINNSSIINLDNIDEVLEFCKLSNQADNELVGLRVNFDLESACPGQTTAGKEVSRFGLDSSSEEFREAIRMLNKIGKNRIGLHMHTSTKTRSIDVFGAICDEVIRIVRNNQLDPSYIDIGGGFFGGQFVQNKPTMKEYAEVICGKLKNELNPEHTTLILEPGASVLATCVTYATKVLNVRDIRDSRIVTLDGTILHINPFMSKRNQPYELVECTDKIVKSREVKKRQILCGSTCMENDRISVIEEEKELVVGDVLHFQNVGAYTMVFNSNFIFNPPSIIEINESKL